MRNNTKHTLKKKWHVPNIVDWLNGESRESWKTLLAPSDRRLKALVLLFQEAFRTIKSSPDPDVFKSEKCVKAMTELNFLLSSYPAVHKLAIVGKTREWDLGEWYRSQGDDYENVLAHVILKVAKDGDLERIRKCSCNKWFFARIESQTFCSARCRRKLYESSQEYKEHRRKYMRQYYKLKTSGKVK
jgi:hypothetical protein